MALRLWMFALTGCAPTTGASAEEPPARSDAASDSGVPEDDSTPCEVPPREYALPMPEGQRSPYGTQILADLDGGGLPDLIHEQREGRRGVAMVRGEDLALGYTWSTSIVFGRLESSQAGFSVGAVGDLDGDGLHDLGIAEGTWGGAGVVTVTSPVRPDDLLLRLDLPNVGDAQYLLLPESSTDLDGDGLEELIVASSGPVYVFPGTLTEGAHGASAAWLTVYEGLGSPVVTPDLDGDGLADLSLSGPASDARQRVLFAGDAPEGALSIDDLPVLLDFPSLGPVFMDVDDDGHPEMYADDQGWTEEQESTVHGFAGGRLSLVGGGGLGAADAALRIEGEAGDYLGANLETVTDDTCLPGLALSGHLAGRVYLVDNAQLVAGGVIDARSRALSGPAWFGYAMDGGADLDGDGALDLVAGAMSGDLRVFLSPFGALSDAP